MGSEIDLVFVCGPEMACFFSVEIDDLVFVVVVENGLVFVSGHRS